MMAQPTSRHRRRNGPRSGCGAIAGDRLELVERAAGMAEAAARDHRHIGAAGGQRRRQHQATRCRRSPPVECLSTTGPGRSQSSTCPESRIARVSATRPCLAQALQQAPPWRRPRPAHRSPRLRRGPSANQRSVIGAGQARRRASSAMILRASTSSAPVHVRGGKDAGQKIGRRSWSGCAAVGGARASPARRLGEFGDLLAAAAAGRHRARGCRR